MQIGGQTNRGIPTVRNESRAVLLRHPADAPLLGDAADFRYVRLHDVERAGLQPGRNACRRVRSSPAINGAS